MSAEEAAELGLVDRVRSCERLEAAISAARRLGTRPKAAIAAAKRAIYKGGSLPLTDGLRFEVSRFMATVPAPEAIRAMEAYVARLERTGELPLHDPETIERVAAKGCFGWRFDPSECACYGWRRIAFSQFGRIRSRRSA